MTMLRLQKFQKKFIKPRHRTVQGEMNKTEAKYAAHLNLLKMSGEILDWKFEPMKFRMADKTYWTPDFLVIYPDKIAIHDTKAMRKFKTTTGEIRETFFAEDDAMVKIKVIAELFWFLEVAVVYQNRSGNWIKKEF